MSYFDIENIALEWQGYRMSWLEAWGTLFGMWAVWLSSREKIASWPIGVVNVVLFFFLFYQIQLYSDMLLQVFFLATNLYGWYRWSHPRNELESNSRHELKVSSMGYSQRLLTAALAVAGTAAAGWCIARFHVWMPNLFPKAAAYPYADTFILVVSIMAQLLLTRKVIENWILWIIVDALATGLYLSKGVLLMSVEYAVFCLIAAYGYCQWRKALHNSD